VNLLNRPTDGEITKQKSPKSPSLKKKRTAHSLSEQSRILQTAKGVRQEGRSLQTCGSDEREGEKRPRLLDLNMVDNAGAEKASACTKKKKQPQKGLKTLVAGGGDAPRANLVAQEWWRGKGWRPTSGGPP